MIINAPIPFDRTSPEWKLAMISYLLNMKANGFNIEQVDLEGVRKKKVGQTGLTIKTTLSMSSGTTAKNKTTLDNYSQIFVCYSTITH